jgi:hypothetical protein
VQTTKIKNLAGPVKPDFEVQALNDTLIVLDSVVLDMSDHPLRTYVFGIEVYEVYTNGKLVDKIPLG